VLVAWICASSELLEFISIVRILRLFKLTHHSPGLKILILMSTVSCARGKLVVADSRSSSRHSVRAPMSSACLCSFSSSDLSFSRLSSTTSSVCSCPPAIQLNTPASRPFHSDSGGRSLPWQRSAMATWLHALTSGCWSGRCVPCLEYWRSTYPCRSSSTTSACSTHTLRRAPSYPRCVGAWLLLLETRWSRILTLLGLVLSVKQHTRTSSRNFDRSW